MGVVYGGVLTVCGAVPFSPAEIKAKKLYCAKSVDKRSTNSFIKVLEGKRGAGGQEGAKCNVISCEYAVYTKGEKVSGSWRLVLMKPLCSL